MTTGNTLPTPAPTKPSYTQTVEEAPTSPQVDISSQRQRQGSADRSPNVHGPTVLGTTSSQPGDVTRICVPLKGNDGDVFSFPHMPMKLGKWGPEDYEERTEYVVSELWKIMAGDFNIRPFVDPRILSPQMVGRTHQSAKPSIVIHCRDDILEAVKTRIRASAIRGLGCYDDSFSNRLSKCPKDYAPFKLVYNATKRPWRQCMAKGDVDALLFSADTLCGALITYEQRKATAGIMLAIDGMDAMLTVDHLFHPDASAISSDDDFLPKSASDNGFSIEGLSKIGSEHSPSFLIADGQLLPLPQSLDATAPYRDWSLMKLNGPKRNLVFPEGVQKPFHLLDTIGRTSLAEPVAVYMVSGVGGIRAGYMSNRFSYFGSKTGQTLCKAWTLILTADAGLSRLIPGECGSIVIDSSTFEVYGHVVASDALDQIYVVPLQHTLEQIKQCFAAQDVGLYKEPIERVVATSSDPSSSSLKNSSKLSTPIHKGQGRAIDHKSDDATSAQDELEVSSGKSTIYKIPQNVRIVHAEDAAYEVGKIIRVVKQLKKICRDTEALEGLPETFQIVACHTDLIYATVRNLEIELDIKENKVDRETEEDRRSYASIILMTKVAYPCAEALKDLFNEILRSNNDVKSKMETYRTLAMKKNNGRVEEITEKLLRALIEVAEGPLIDKDHLAALNLAFQEVQNAPPSLEEQQGRNFHFENSRSRYQFIASGEQGKVNPHFGNGPMLTGDYSTVHLTSPKVD